MAKACIAIGVGRTNGLAALPGAVNGARNIAAWAKAAGYQTELVVDENDAGKPVPVTIARVSAALMRLLPPANDEVDRGGPADPPERLLVYFAGHGMLTMSNDDLWLLSDSYNDQLAIGITQLQDMLKTYLPKQIAIVSDACRSPATANWNVRMVPMPVVPRGQYDPSQYDQIDIDRFLAVPPLTAAYMVRSTPEAPARCIFTSVLLEALHGIAPECFDQDRKDDVTSQSIARYLRRNVKLRASQFQVEMRPQAFPCWLEPDTYVTRAELAAMNLAALDAWPGAGAATDQGGSEATAIFKSFGAPLGIVRGEDHHADILAPQLTARSVSLGGADFETSPEQLFSHDELAQLEEERAQLAAQIADVEARQARIKAALARTDRITHLETACGLTVAGGTVTSVHAQEGVETRPDGAFAGSWQVDFHTGHPIGRSAWLLAALDAGAIVATTALGGYMTDCILEPEGCVASSFRQCWLDPAIRLRSEEVLCNGTLSGANADDALDWIGPWRNAQVFDPMLGVLAAYLFHAAGLTNSVRRLGRAYAARGLPLPFDIALLCYAPVVTQADGSVLLQIPAVGKCKPRTSKQKKCLEELSASDALTIPVAGSIPLIRQGWFQLDRAADGLVRPGLAELAPLLRSSLFATFDPAAGRPLAAALGA